MSIYNCVHSIFQFLKEGRVYQQKLTVASTLKILVWGLISLFAVNFFLELVQMLLVRWNLITAGPSHGAIPEYLRELPTTGYTLKSFYWHRFLNNVLSGTSCNVDFYISGSALRLRFICLPVKYWA
jgi:hypothetical protein